MKKLFMLSGAALMVSSSLTMAAGNNPAKYDFESFDANKDGQISVVEAKGKLAKHFDKIDTDGNDLISKAEFTEMQKMKKARQSKKPTFADFDSNNDGSISRAEFEAMKKMKKGQHHQKADFAKVDANQDGKITKDEAKGGLLKHFDKIDSDANGSISTTEFAAMERMHKGKGNHKLDFGTIDVNNDSQITKDEAKGGLLKHFDKIDSDANGSISTTEFAAMERMHKGKGNHKLDFAQVDANSDGVITKEEVKGRLLKHFDKIDTDKNGSISATEFSAMEKMHKGKGHKKGKGNHRLDFAQVDANSDGVITKEEAKGRLLKHFDKVDTDANGSITSAEFELIKNMKKGQHGHKVSFSTLDANNDGAITKDEAKGRLLKNFDKIDSDANGKITAQELDVKRADRKGNKRPTFEMLDTDGNGKISKAEFDVFNQQHAKMKAQIK